MDLPGHGLVVGRFLPPHAGHHLFLERALDRCRHLTVCVLARPGERLGLAPRQLALEEMHPAARVIGGELEPAADAGDPAAWAGLVRAIVGEPADALFAGEGGGEALASSLSVAHVPIERQPADAPVVSAAVRADPRAHWRTLSPAIRAELARRVIVTGSESTGKTSLAKLLARRYGTVWVPEFGRELTIVKQQRTVPPEPWQAADFSWIAAEQERATHEAARRSGPLVIADTDAVATQVWEERYLERASHATERIAAASRADLYLLTLPDVPWVADGIRDGDQDLRRWMTERIRGLIARRGVPVVELTGTWQEREQAAVAACDELLARSWSLTSSAV